MMTFDATKKFAMTTTLLLIDVQESFRFRPYWNPAAGDQFLRHTNRLIEGCIARRIPIVRIFHTDGPSVATNPFAVQSGHIKPLRGLHDFDAATTFEKHRHSALVGTGLSVWLHQQGIKRLMIAGIRTEQCCETTTRHASDEGWVVDYITEATLTFDMQTPQGNLMTAAHIVERTETVLSDRFAAICTVDQALSRAT